MDNNDELWQDIDDAFGMLIHDIELMRRRLASLRSLLRHPNTRGRK